MSGPPHKVFACAADESLDAVRALGIALGREGLELEVVPGTDLDTRALGSAIDEHPGPGLWVIFESDDLDRYQIRRLVGVFSARRGPEHHLLVTKLNRLQPKRVLDKIVVAVEKQQRVLSDSAAQALPMGPDADVNMRDVVETKISAVTEQSGATIAQGRAPEPEEDVEETAREPGAAVPVAVSREPSVEIDFDLDDGAAASGAKKARPARDDADSASEDGEPPLAPPTEALAAQTERSGPSVGIIIGVLAVAAGVAAFFFTQRPQPGPPPAVAKKNLEPTKTVGEPENALANSRPPRDPTPAGGPEDAPPDDPPAGATSGDIDGARVDDSPEDEPPDDDPAADDPAVDEPTGDDAGDTPTSGVKREGELRELDGLLISRRNQTPTNWFKGQDYCRRVRAGGLKKWRLPSKDELVTLQRARVLRKGAYWAATHASRDGSVVFVIRHHRPYPKVWDKDDKALSICVQNDPR